MSLPAIDLLFVSAGLILSGAYGYWGMREKTGIIVKGL